MEHPYQTLQSVYPSLFLGYHLGYTSSESSIEDFVCIRFRQVEFQFTLFVHITSF